MSRVYYRCPICGVTWSDMPIRDDDRAVDVWCRTCSGGAR